ncbi:hypothetical protein, partial [Acinetobacter sichuanensis]
LDLQEKLSRLKEISSTPQLETLSEKLSRLKEISSTPQPETLSEKTESIYTPPPRNRGFDFE